MARSTWDVGEAVVKLLVDISLDCGDLKGWFGVVQVELSVVVLR